MNGENIKRVHKSHVQKYTELIRKQRIHITLRTKLSFDLPFRVHAPVIY